MPQYIFKYEIDGEEYFSSYSSKRKLSQHQRMNKARKVFFEERKIKLRTKLIKEEYE